MSLQNKAFSISIALLAACRTTSISEVRSAWMMCEFDRTVSVIHDLPKDIKRDATTILREARALNELQRFEPALRLLTSIIQSKDIDHQVLRLELASALSGLNRWQEALKLIDDLEEEGADAGLIAFYRGIVAYERGERDSAGMLLWEAVRLDPEQPGAWFNLAVVLAEQDERGPARWALEKAWKTGLRYPEGIRREAGFRSMIEAGMLDDMLSSQDAPLCDTWW